MRKLSLLMAVITAGVCLCGCFGDKSNGTENTTTTIVGENSTEAKEEGKEEETKPLGKVDVITIVTGGDLEYYCTKDAVMEDSVEGYIVGFTKEQMLIEECDWVEDENQPNGFRIDMVGENTIELAEEVEVWGLYFGTGTGYICIPLEDIDNYEVMRGCRGYWTMYKNAEGKVCMIVEHYIP